MVTPLPRSRPGSPRPSWRQCITFATLFVPETWVFRAGRREKSARIHSRLVVNTAEAAIDAAVAGVGLTRVLSYQVAESVKTRDLVVVLRNFEPDPVPVNLVYTGERPLPRKLRVVLDFAAPRLKARLSGTPTAARSA
ncbi:MAG TPA: LysR substrate-binding domain-containing protein [Candidatus Dormibacteraeota bacterium]|nr:LysR substrate-binding domain-containing protein [Candidatus Dormibacteraeota bacterium]